MGHGGTGEVEERRQTAAARQTTPPFPNNDSSFYRFRSIARSYFRKAHGVLLLYDVTSESSFLSVRAWVDQVQVTVTPPPPPQWRGWACFSFLCSSTGLHRGQNPDVCGWKQGGPARAASRGQLRQRPAGREAGQGASSFSSRAFERDVNDSDATVLCPRRRTAPCSVKPAPKMEPTSSRPCFTSPGRKPEGVGVSFQQLGVFIFSFRREVKKSVTGRRQSDSQVRLSPARPKTTFDGCCRL